MPINNHTKELFLYIAFAPEEIKKKYNNGYNRWFTYKQKDKTIKEENKEWYFMRNNLGDSSFAGLLFRENKVYVHNIYLYDVKNDYKEQYLEITGIFNELLKKYNIYHACILALAVLKNSCKESYLTENIILYVKTDREYHLSKFRYQLARHHSREKNSLLVEKVLVENDGIKYFIKPSIKFRILAPSQVLEKRDHSCSYAICIPPNQNFVKLRTSLNHPMVYKKGQESQDDIFSELILTENEELGIVIFEF